MGLRVCLEHSERNVGSWFIVHDLHCIAYSTDTSKLGYAVSIIIDLAPRLDIKHTLLCNVIRLCAGILMASPILVVVIEDSLIREVLV